MAAREMGTTTWNRKRVCPAPSMRAASYSSSGIWRKNWRSRKMPNVLASQGTVRPNQPSIQRRPSVLAMPIMPMLA